ncbi:MAG: redoxin domain-containing protein, partial [Candidatus Limnocylindrales bacterium]
MLLFLAACTAPSSGLPSAPTASPAEATPAAATPATATLAAATPATATLSPEAPGTQTPPADPGATATPETQPDPTTAGATFDQAWAVATLTDVSTGAQFRIADIAASGKVVFLEPMAMWCANCRAQQREALAALQQLDPDAVEWIGIDVESSETPEALARYRDQNGFPFRYVVADTALARSLAAEFGDVVLSP